MGAIQMLFRLGLALGALGAGALAHAVRRIIIGSGAAALSLDGNQVGLIVGGFLILLGAAASSGIARPAGEEPA